MLKRTILFTVFIVAVLTIFLIGTSSAQTQKTTSKLNTKFEDTPSWNVAFIVSIEGEGTRVNSDVTKTWKIDRKYSGFLVLNHRILQPNTELPVVAKGYLTKEQLADYEKQMAILGNVRWDNAGATLEGTEGALRDVHVFINDKLETDIYSPGEGKSWMRTITNETWFCDSHIKAIKFSTFNTDTKHFTFTVSIPIDSLGGEKLIKHQGIKKITYSDSQIVPEPPEKIDEELSFSQIPAPTVNNLIEGGTISYKSPAGSLNTNSETWEFTTPEMPPEYPFLGISDIKDEVKIKVYFKFSKTNLGNKVD